VSIVPFQKPNATSPDSALLIMEDQTQREQLRRLEIEASSLRLVRMMAERLAHEIGNALVPISIHQQLLPTEFADAEFRLSLETALSDGVKRISRLVSQMMFLAQDTPGELESIDMRSLVEDAFAEARKYQPAQSTVLKLTQPTDATQVTGHRVGLRHALCEILINALQASAPSSEISVRTHSAPDADGNPWTHIEVVDSGAGFSADVAKHAADPFFTTRNVGLGLGLTVSRKIIETHRGRLSFDVSGNGRSGIVRVSLPTSG